MTVVAVLLAGCASDTATSEGARPEPATAIAAPTVAGTMLETEPITEDSSVELIDAEAVIVGVPAEEMVLMRALPGPDQPVISEFTPTTQVELLDQVFESPDGSQWWQVRAGAFQGWIPPIIGYRGPTSEITDTAGLTGESFESPAAAALSVVASTGLGADADVVYVGENVIAGASNSTLTVDLYRDTSPELGERLTIGTSLDGGWTPILVVRSPLCENGVTTDGTCV